MDRIDSRPWIGSIHGHGSDRLTRVTWIDSRRELDQLTPREGEHKERYKIARNLLAKGLEPALVAETTGLSINQLATFSK